MSVSTFWQPQWLGLGFVVCFIFATGFYYWIEQKGVQRETPGGWLRTIKAFQRMRRSIDLVVESGRQLHLSLGRGGLRGLPGASAIVGLNILQWLGRLTSRCDCPPFMTSGNGEVNFLAQDVLDAIDRSRAVDPRDQLLKAQIGGLTPYSYAAAAMCDIQDEKVTINLLAGHFGSEVGLISDAGERNDALTIGSSDALSAQAILFAATKESLVGEEFYATGAYMHSTPWYLASLRAQDAMHWVIILIIIAGIIWDLIV